MNRPPFSSRVVIGAMIAASLLTACSDSADTQTTADQKTGHAYPIDDRDQRKERVGKLTGDGLIVGGGDSAEKKETGKNPLGVNSFLWRATLDTLAFMPLASADPFGGVIITDWYEDAQAPGERFKVNALILDRQLRSDSLKISVFRQKKDRVGNWVDMAGDSTTGRKLEDTVLTRARQLRVAQLGY